MKEKKQQKRKKKKGWDPLSLTVLLIALCVCVFRVSACNDDGSVLHWR